MEELLQENGTQRKKEKEGSEEETLLHTWDKLNELLLCLESKSCAKTVDNSEELLAKLLEKIEILNRMIESKDR